jgi:drug/metabolite transporter (DMT)-like permease
LTTPHPLYTQKALLALLLVYLVWGTTMAAIHFGVQTIPPLLLACIRFLLAGGMLILISLAQGERWPSWKETRNHGVIGFLLFFGGNALSCWALQTLSTGLAGMIIATTPFWMLAMSDLSDRYFDTRAKRFSLSVCSVSGSPWANPKIVLSMVLGFIGIMILLSPQLAAPELTSPLFGWSILAMLVLCWFWSAGSLYARYHQGEASVWMALGIQNFLAGVLLLPICYALGDWNAFNPSESSLWALGYLVVFGTIVTTPCYYYVLKHLPVSISSSFAFVNPVITLLVGCLFLGEVMTMESWVGSVVVVIAVLMLQWASNPSSQGDETLINQENKPLIKSFD